MSALFRLALLLLLAAPAFAHPAPYSYLDLRLGQRTIEATLTAHTLDLAHELNLTPADALLDPALAAAKQAELLNLLRARLAVLADGRTLAVELARVEPLPERQALALHLRFAANAAPGLLKIRCALFSYDPQHQTFLNIYETDTLVRQEVFDHARAAFDHFTGTRQGTMAAVKTCFINGVHHCFSGADHWLFLAGLLLLGGSLPRLLLCVAAFTLAHSLTLALAALHLVNPPARWSAAALTLSLVYLGIDNLLVGAAGRDVRGWIALAFGLAHGFDVAAVWRELGVPNQAQAWPLGAFSLGLAIGQAGVLSAVAPGLAAWRQRYPALNKRVIVGGSVAVSLAGAYWFVRGVFFGG